MRACPVQFKRAKQSAATETARLPAEVALFHVEACEIDPPAGVVPAASHPDP